jgi:hypothetical protein
MSMTRKDFAVLAEQLAQSWPSNPAAGDANARRRQWQKDVLRICRACRQINPSFDQVRFLAHIHNAIPAPVRPVALYF